MTNANPSAPTPGEGSAPKKSAEPPKYRLKAPCYIGDTLYDQAAIDKGAVIFFEKTPGSYMHPLNEAAREMVAKHKPKAIDPVEQLMIVGPNAIVLKPHDAPGSPGS